MKIIAVKSGSEYVNNNGIVSVVTTKEAIEERNAKITKVEGGDDSVTFHRTYIKDSNGKVTDVDKNESDVIELSPENINFDKSNFSAITSGVGDQDTDTSNMSFGDATLRALGKSGNTLLKGATGLSTSEWQKFGNDVATVFGQGDGPSVSVFDTRNNAIINAKSEVKKEIHVDDWRDVDNLNTQANYADTMAEDLRGEVGKSNLNLTGGHEKGWAGLGNAALSSLASGLGAGGLSQGVASFFDSDRISSAEDAAHIIELNNATKDTIYTSKPGGYVQIRSQKLLGGDNGYTYRNVINHPGKDANGISVALQNLEQIRKANFARKAYVKTNDEDGFDSSIEFRKKRAVIEAKRPSEATYIEKQSTGEQITYAKNANLFTSSGLGNLSEEEAKYINLIKQRNSYNKKLGYIYIKPFWNYSNAREEDFKIPFEFTPEISEGAVQANYATETLLNRLGQYHVYTGTNLSTLNITLTYEALAPDTLDAEGEAEIGKQYGTDAWMFYWTNNRIEAIEMQLRSLVFADVTSSSDGVLIKPPLIEVHLENSDGEDFDSVGDLYKYPGNKGSDNYVGSDYLKISAVLSENGQASRYKKYIVNSVQIEKLDDAGTLYPSLYGRKYNKDYDKNRNPMYHIEMSGNKGYAGYSRRMGFKAVIQCTEVVENFLDLVPDFKAYYDAWSIKNQLADYSSDYADIYFGTDEGYNTVEEILTGSLYSLISDISSLDDRLIAYYNEAAVIAKIYNRAVGRNYEGQEDKSTNIYKLNSNSEGGIYSRLSEASKDIIDNSKCTTGKGNISFSGIDKLEFNIDMNIGSDTVGTAMSSGSFTDETGDDIKKYLCETSLKNIWVPSKNTTEVLGYKFYKKDDKKITTAYSDYLSKICNTVEEIGAQTTTVLDKMNSNLTVPRFVANESLNKEFIIENGTGVVPFVKECIGSLTEKINDKWKLEVYKNIFINISCLDQEENENENIQKAVEDIKELAEKLDREEFIFLDDMLLNINTRYCGPFGPSGGQPLYYIDEDSYYVGAEATKNISETENNLNTLKSKIDNLIKLAKNDEKSKEKAAKSAAKSEGGSEETEESSEEVVTEESEKLSKIYTDYLNEVKEALNAFSEIKNLLKKLKEDYQKSYECFENCVKSYDALYNAIVHTNLCNMSALVYGSPLVRFTKEKSGINLSITDGSVNYKENLKRNKNGTITEINKYKLSEVKGVKPYSCKEFFNCYKTAYEKIINEFENLASENPEVDLGSKTIEDAKKAANSLNSTEAFLTMNSAQENLKTIDGESSYKTYISQKMSPAEADSEKENIKDIVASLGSCIKNEYSTADEYMAIAAGKMYTFFSLQGLTNAFKTLVGNGDKDVKTDLGTNYSQYMITSGREGETAYKNGGENNPEWVYGLYEHVFKELKNPGSGESVFHNKDKYGDSSDAGLIPSMYFKIMESQDLKQKMQIAGSVSSVETVNKLKG